MLAEGLAVVRGHDHERVLEEVHLTQVVQEAADLLVEPGDGLLMQRPHVVPERSRLLALDHDLIDQLVEPCSRAVLGVAGRVGAMGVQVVDEEEPRRAGGLGPREPGERALGHPAAGLAPHVPEVEPLLEPEAGPQVDRVRDDPAGRVAALLQGLRQRLEAAVEREDVVSPMPLAGHEGLRSVLEREETREHGRVAGEGPRRRRDAGLVTVGHGREGVEVRRRVRGPPVAGQVVRADGVQGDQDDRGRRHGRISAAGGQRAEEREGGAVEAAHGPWIDQPTSGHERCETCLVESPGRGTCLHCEPWPGS